MTPNNHDVPKALWGKLSDKGRQVFNTIMDTYLDARTKDYCYLYKKSPEDRKFIPGARLFAAMHGRTAAWNYAVIAALAVDGKQIVGIIKEQERARVAKHGVLT